MIGIIIGLAMYFILKFTSPTLIGAVIGTKSITLLQTSHKAEKIIFYIDQSAELASKNAAYYLAEKGISNCGEFNGYNLLNNKTKDIDECFTNIENNFQIIFNKNLNNYISLYPDYNIPQKNYDTIINKESGKTRVLGFANNNIEFEAIKKPLSPYKPIKEGEKIVIEQKGVLKNTSNKLLEYSIKPNFKANLDFDLNIFNKIKEQAKELIENCSEKKDEELKMCILVKMGNMNKENSFKPKWEAEDIIGTPITKRKFKFHVDTGKQLFPYENNVIIKFALYFPEPTP